MAVAKNEQYIQASGAGVAFSGAAWSMSGIINASLTNSDVIKLYVWAPTEGEVCYVYGTDPGFPTTSLVFMRVAN
jgi:hypothetical protein